LGFALACLVSCLAHPKPARSQDSNAIPPYALTITLDRPDAIYQRADRVTFTIKLARDSKPVEDATVHWTLSKDGVAPISKGDVKLTNGATTVTGKIDEPGFLQCRATFQTPAKQTVTAYSGAAIDPLQIGPSLPVPDDFSTFWDVQKKKLAAVPINPRLTPIKPPSSKVETFDLQADSVGAPVSGYFARPTDARSRSLPIILLVHGAGVRSSSLDSAASWARKEFLALDMNAHGIGNGQPDKFYADLSAGELKNYPTLGRESRDTVYFLGMFLRLVRALNFLTIQPEWDGRTVIVHGSSQGGAQAIVAAGLDSRVTFFAAGVPAMCDHTGSVVGRVCGWPKFVPKGADGTPDSKVLEVARYYDAMNFARRTQADGIVTVGFIDTVCPPTSVYAMYNALVGRKEIFNDPPSQHHVSKEAGDAMRSAILAHVEKRRAKPGSKP